MPVRLNGSTSGYTELSAPAVAANNTLTLPTTTSGSLVALDSSGRLGIGTSGPTQLLSLASASGNSYIEVAGGGYTLGTNSAYYGQDSSGNGVMWNRGNNYLLFGTNNTERVRIDNSGRLLVGTSTSTNAPANCKLVVDISGASSRLEGANGYGLDIVSPAVPPSGYDLGVLGFKGYTTGTTEAYGAFIIGKTDGAWSSGSAPTRLVFSTTSPSSASPTERARITSGGYFKASNSGSYSQYSLAATLHHFESNTGAELAAAFINSSTNPYGVIVRYTGAASNDTGHEFLIGADTTTNRFAFRSNGGLANFSANNSNLSDRNAKKDISPAADTWNCLKEWEIVNYRYKDQPDDADLNLGVIAQQVAESCPEVITIFQEAKEATEDAPAREERLGVKEQQMYWMAIKALQEAQVRIETLESNNASLEARLTALEVTP